MLLLIINPLGQNGVKLKKKGKGAIIGGAVGAAGGYILGRKKDKKNQADTTQ